MLLSLLFLGNIFHGLISVCGVSYSTHQRSDFRWIHGRYKVLRYTRMGQIA